MVGATPSTDVISIRQSFFGPPLIQNETSMKVQPPTFSLLILALLLGISAVLLFAILRSPHVWTVDIGETDDTYFAEHFLKPQRTGDTSFRWSGPGSRLMLHGAYAGPLVLDLHLFG